MVLVVLACPVKPKKPKRFSKLKSTQKLRQNWGNRQRGQVVGQLHAAHAQAVLSLSVVRGELVLTPVRGADHGPISLKADSFASPVASVGGSSERPSASQVRLYSGGAAGAGAGAGGARPQAPRSALA